MQFPEPIPVTDLAEQLSAKLIGNDQLLAHGINEIHQVAAGDITFVDVAKYYQKALRSEATIILIDQETECPEGKALLVVDQPFAAYDGLVRRYRPWVPLSTQIHESAQIHPSAVIEPGVIIGPQAIIGERAYLQANAYIGAHTRVGAQAIVQAGAIIGTSAFYFKRENNRYNKWQTGGRVVLEERVDIGPGCTINAGVSSDTLIGAGTKMDSQVHIGHDVKVGKDCLFAGQVGIGGNTVVGDRVVLYGQVGIAQNLTIGDEVVVLAKSGVSKNLEGGKVYFGYPAMEARTKYRELAAMRHLPKFLQEYYK